MSLYARILRHPRMAALYAAALVARLPVGINGLAVVLFLREQTGSFAVPGAVAAKLAYPDRKVVAVTGDAGFMMNSQEIETAVREQIPLVVLIWEDGGYGLIEWKMDLELGEHHYIKFTNPDVVTFAESFGATGYRITEADQLLPTLKKA